VTTSPITTETTFILVPSFFSEFKLLFRKDS
jgi:hypothetical protein